MKVEKERGHTINFLEELKDDGTETVNFISPEGIAKRVDLTEVPNTEYLFAFLGIKPALIRYYPLDRRPYFEVCCKTTSELVCFYIEKIK